MAGLPLLKLSALFIKTLSKPLGTRLKFEAGRNPKFFAFSLDIGQKTHYLSSRVNVIASGYKFLGVKPLGDDEAVDLGVSYIADGVVVAIGATIIIVEYMRSEAKSKAKADKADAVEAELKAALEARFKYLETELSDIRRNLPLMQQVMLILESLLLEHYIDAISNFYAIIRTNVVCQLTAYISEI